MGRRNGRKRAAFHRDVDDYVSEFDGAGGPRLFVAGLVLMVVSCLVTLELTGITVSFNSAPLEWWLSLPIIVIYPLLFGWVSYQTATKLAEHKRRLQVMSTRDGMTGVYNRRHWETMLRNEFDNCRRHNRDATLLIIDIDHFKSINDTGAMMWAMKRLWRLPDSYKLPCAVAM